MEANLKIRSRESSTGNFEVTIEGRLDSATYKQLEGFLEGVLTPATRSLRFDLAKLDYISSMGLRVFLKSAKVMRSNAGKLAMINLQPQIKKVIDIANALTSLSVFDSVEEADRYLDLMQRQVLEAQNQAELNKK